MEYQNIAILGAGAVGAYVVWGLSEKQGVNICLVAEGKRRERLQRDGLVINGKVYHPEVKTPSEARGADLLVVALKWGSLEESLGNIATVTADNTTVMSLMNGVESEDIIASVVGTEKVVPSVIRIASERNQNDIRFNPAITLGITYGEPNGNMETERMQALDRLFSGTELKCQCTDSINGNIWSKFRRNMQYNLPQALVGCGLGAYEDSEHMDFLRAALGAEVEAVAKAKGISMPPVIPGSVGAKAARYSTLQDLDAHRHTEVDMFAGAMIRMGRELHVPTPYSEMAYHLIKALEEKNDGLFSY